MRALVHKKLKAGWSPWQIEWHLKHDLSNELEHKVTHETIYRYIYSHWERRNEFAPCLRRKRLSRVRQGSRKKRFPSCMLISTRPDEIEKRETFGHWECDLMMFQRGIKHNLITLVERMSRYTIAIKNDNKQSKTTAYAIISRLKQYKPFIKSITFDQGSEFLKFPLIQDCLNTAVYFCNPASPYQKGSIENRNGVIRTIFPRNCNIFKVEQKELNTYVELINERPMKCLNYYSPTKLFNNYTK